MLRLELKDLSELGADLSVLGFSKEELAAASILKAIAIIQPETLVRWHRAGFRRYWRWKSRSLGGRPPIEADLRVLIRRMSLDNPLWGAPRIHGELLKLGFEVAQSTVANGMDRPCSRPTTRRVSWGFEEHEEQTPCPAKQTPQ
jgi:hypothetical protein